MPPHRHQQPLVGSHPAGPAGHPGYPLFADILRSTLPLMEAFGVATAADVDLETYARRLAEEVAANDAMAGCAPAVTAGDRASAMTLQILTQEVFR